MEREKIKEILSKCDHTLLKPEATFDDIRALYEDAVKYKTAAVCIPPCFVKQLRKEYPKEKSVSEKLPKICTVIGFPLGSQKTEIKVMEAKEALRDGADEIDVVINIGKVKEKDYNYVYSELKDIRSVCLYKTLKIIVETALLTEKEIRNMVLICEMAGADYIKTSTGFSSRGVSEEDVKIMKESIENGLKIKASGGISSLEHAEKLIELGADRLGTSRIVEIVKETEQVF